MATIQPGNAAPSFTLASLEGKSYSLADGLKKGTVVAAFFKISCPVCQFTFPFIQRIHESYGDGKVSFWGVSQDNARDTKVFMEQFGVTFPALLDSDGYKVSKQFGLTNVPSIFLIQPDGKVGVSCIGFGKAELEKIAGEVARASGKPAVAIFQPGEKVPDHKPG